MAMNSGAQCHADFTAGDVELTVGDGTQFRIDASTLRRTSLFFAAMFQDARPDSATPGAPTQLAVDEDAHTVEVLLKIASGLRFPRALVADMGAIERLARAAEKYGVGAALDVVQLLLDASGLRTPEAALRRYALACRHGWAEIANDAANDALDVVLDYGALPQMEMRDLARLLAFRQRRVDAFAARLEEDAGAVGAANAGLCPEEHYKSSKHRPRSGDMSWQLLKQKMLLEMQRRPSGSTLFADEDAIAVLRKAYCAQHGLGNLYKWEELREDIRSCIPLLPTSLISE